MKTIKHSMLYVRDPKTGKFQSLQAIVGESAYEIAVRLGTFSGTEEEWNNFTHEERDSAIAAIQKKGEEVLASLPADYTELSEEVLMAANSVEI